jgi:uncharacterized protein (DUF1778 family)
MSSKDDRVYFRLTVEEKKMLKDASEMVGMSMTSFVRDTAILTAKMIVNKRQNQLVDTLGNVGKMMVDRAS